MGIVVQLFPVRHGHCRAPTGSAGSIRHSSGDASKPKPSSAAVKTTNVSGGQKPRARQLVTACGDRPTSRATSVPPPKASMTSPTVPSVLRSGIDMDGNLYTNCVSDKPPHLVCSRGLSVSARSAAMAERSVHPRSLEAVRARLIALRMAKGPNQRQFSTRAGIEPNTWGNYENDPERRISIEEAFKLVDTYGVSLDWIYEGRAVAMPGDLMNKIREVEAEAVIKAAAA